MATKKLENYLTDGNEHKTSLGQYGLCPAHTFLTYVCDANDAFNHCLNKFTKKAGGAYNKDSQDSLQHLSRAILGTVMGHFETYQKSLLAGLIERTVDFESFNFDQFVKALDQASANNFLVPSVRLGAFRGSTAPVGFLFADSLKNWHSPTKVNAYLKALGVKVDFFSPVQVGDIQILWQLRHSIVHTGGWLTIPDAQKVPQLKKRADKPIIFEHTFVNAMTRRLHKTLKESHHRLEAECLRLLGNAADQVKIAEMKAFLKVSSPVAVWLQ